MYPPDRLPPSSEPSHPLTAPPSKAAPHPLRKALDKLGLVRDIDLALHLPLRYEDETRITVLHRARQGDIVQIEATVVHSDIQLHPRRQLVVTVADDTGSCELRFFSFYPSHQKTLAIGERVRARGEIKGGFWGRHMLHPAFRRAQGPLPAALTPIYPSTAQLPQAYLRRVIASALQRVQLPETIPPDCMPMIAGSKGSKGSQGLWGLREALSFLHNPPPDVALCTLEDHSHPAWQRLKAEELLAQQLSQYSARQARSRLCAPALRGDPLNPLAAQLHKQLPFALTGAQQRVCAEISADVASTRPMHRLLQGDVGSGKTVVAALAACVAIDAGWQCALMAPTEILAQQHFGKLADWLAPILTQRGQMVAWLAGAQKKKQRSAMLGHVASGEAALVVGTHAVIQEQVQFARLGLAVIDEQHRFGVAQRLALRHKLAAQGMEPHVLMMSATPIPRTLAMTYYADLDVSTIDELPPGRTPVVTRAVCDSRKDEVIARLVPQLASGRQVYWVCPLIEESEALDLSNATATHAQLSEALPGCTIGLLHSRMPNAEKKAVMQAFQNGSMAVLVATTVIEVGVDVPNASLMVIEHAERFGLSQLHQLRGRVGRGATASACVLLYAAGDSGYLGHTARERLTAMTQTNDGFEIARRDLDIRGPGEFLGARQSGDALLRFADVALDSDLLHWAREVAPHIWVQHGDLARLHVARWLGAKADYLKA